MGKTKDVMMNCVLVPPPKKIIVFMLITVTCSAGIFLPQVKMDSDPENTLEKTETVRIFHNKTKKEFDLCGVVFVGVANKSRL